MKLTNPLKLIRNGLIAVGLMLGATVAHAVPTTDPSTISTVVTDMAEQAQTALRYAEQVKKWQEELERWQQTYQNMVSGNFSTLMSSLGLGNATLDKDANRKAYAKFIDDYQTNNRCERMSSKQQVAKSLCETRLNIEVAKFKKMAEMLDYSDQKNEEIKEALKNANKQTGTEEKKLALSQVQTLQNNLKDGVQLYTDQMRGYDQQIGVLKTQQAEVARVAMQGKPPGLIGGIASVAIMKGVFKSIQHEVPGKDY